MLRFAYPIVIIEFGSVESYISLEIVSDYPVDINSYLLFLVYCNYKVLFFHV